LENLFDKLKTEALRFGFLFEQELLTYTYLLQPLALEDSLWLAFSVVVVLLCAFLLPEG
jgi:hypothetical protein